MNENRLTIPKNLIASKIKISVGILLFGGIFCGLIASGFHNLMLLLIYSPFIVISVFFAYKWIIVLLKEKQLLFDTNGIYSIYKQNGLKIEDTIQWTFISKIELHCKCRVHYSDGNEIIVYCKNKKIIKYDISEYYSFEGFRIISPKYEERIKQGLELICKENKIKFVLS